MRAATPFLLAVLATLTAPPAAAQQQPLTTEEVAVGLNTPIWVAPAPGDDASRIFVTTHWGRIRIVENDVIKPTPFLDIHHLVTFDGNEQGMLGMVFHPDYAQNGVFYVTYVDLNGDWVMARYLRDAQNPDLADSNSAVILLTIVHPIVWHHGGWMEFGQDGLLYIATGDGGGVGDPLDSGQRGDTLLGKLLRIDVDGGFPYAIPPGNPYVNDPLVLDEIWAMGLRNPWRGDMDDVTGDIWLGDVGQDTWEEVDFLPAGQAAANFGWRIVEGKHCYAPPVGCNQTGMTAPVHEYRHENGPQGYRCSVTGGHVYRGREMATMQGRFFFGDYCSGETFSMRTNGVNAVDFREHYGEFAATMGPNINIVGFGQDADGEIYVCNQADGSVHRIVPAGLRLRVPQLQAGSPATLTLQGGRHNSPFAILYSLTGLGSTPVPPANVVLDLDQPFLLVQGMTNGAGAASHPVIVPSAAAGRSVWFQAGQFAMVSNVVAETVD
jgi:glucose/arabinose dehydrogenase